MKIQFLKDTSKPIINNILKNTIIVYKQGYSLPNINGVEYIDFDKYKIIYSDIETDMIILIGLNRMITPSNRCEMVHEYLSTLTPNIRKISIDTSPFIGEPWRLFFHYLYTGINKFNISYSYAIETEWKHWFYRDVNTCRLSGENIRMFIDDTYSDLDKLITTFKFYEPRNRQLEWYSEAKKHVFSKYNTPKLIISNLLKLSNKHFQLNVSMDSYKSNQIFKLPNIGIYRFLVDENNRRKYIYNEIIRQR